MAVEIIMPKLGVDMAEGEIIEWKKAEGDTVAEGDVLLEIMSDKTNMEIEAEDSGILLKITRQAGETVPVTETIGYIGEAGEEVEIASSAASDVDVARTTEDLEAAGLEVPKAPAQESAPAAEKAPLADNEYD
ncbi:biotin/lipoyl-containing protein, partial [Streptococcus pluranimalium]